MAFKSLPDFLEELAGSGGLVRVAAEVDPHLEIAEITRRVAAERGPAILFERARGQSLAVVTNLLGTTERACLALGLDSFDGLAERIEAVALEHTPQNWFDRLKMGSGDRGLDKLRPKPIKTGVCQQVVHLGRDVNLATFPLVQGWPDESGPSITAGLLITGDVQAQARGVTAAPLVALDDTRLAVIDDGDSAFASHWAEHRAAGQRMPAAVVLGGDPALTIAASLDLPGSVDVLHLIGLIHGKSLDVVKCRTHAIEVPADAELAFEGYFDPNTPDETVVIAGAAGSHYRAPTAAPIFHVAAVTHRNRAIFSAAIDAGLHGEAAVLTKARERMLAALLRSLNPDIADLSLPVAGGPHGFAVVSFNKRFPFHSRQIAAALWGNDALKFTKVLILVDAGVDVHDVARVATQVGANVAPERDVISFDSPAHAADHAGTLGSLARRLAIDATTKLSAEQSGGSPAPLDAGEEIHRQVTARWAEYRLNLIKLGIAPQSGGQLPV
jgi:4-hydroxy-3-polyprenylbenzoate decarboxylase